MVSSEFGCSSATCFITSDNNFAPLDNIVVDIPTSGLEGIGSSFLIVLWSFTSSDNVGGAHALDVNPALILAMFLSPCVSPTLKMLSQLRV